THGYTRGYFSWHYCRLKQNDATYYRIMTYPSRDSRVPSWNDRALGTWSKAYYETYLHLLEVSGYCKLRPQES
ncbi:hypothetical protein ABHI18_007957, partial [Aspergillus niger]